MERRPVYAPIVAFEHVLDHGISLAKDFCRSRVLEVIFKTPRPWCNILFAEP
jgi:hypothetical protein